MTTVDTRVDTNCALGVNDRAVQRVVGVRVGDVEPVVVDGRHVSPKQRDGVTASVEEDGLLEIIDGTSVTAAANATNVYSTSGTEELVIQNSSFEGETGLFLADDVASDTFDSNSDDRLIGKSFIGNASADDTADLSVQEDAYDGDSVNVSLNFLGSNQGPFAADAAGVDTDDEAFVYDPFLTSSEVGEEDPTTTTAFGHDVHIPAEDGFTTVGIPAEPEADTLGELLDVDETEFDFEGAVFAFDADTNTFHGVGPDADVEAFDAFVIENTGDAPTSFLIEYEGDAQTAPTTTQLQEGLNFVASPAAGTSDIFNQDSDNGDTVQERFGVGDNLFGVSDGQSTSGAFATPDERFTNTDGDAELHPHAGYFVTIQEDSQEPIVNDRIFPGVTVDDIEEESQEDS